jgi:hypothetical protein
VRHSARGFGYERFSCPPAAGGPIGLVIGILIGIVNAFLIPSEVGNIFAKAGQPKPVSGPTGFWTFIPLIGLIIWVIKVQNALNDRWETAGAA